MSISITQFFKKHAWTPPQHPNESTPEDYVPTETIGENGILMNVQEQLATVERWKDQYSEIFNLLRNDRQINTQCLGTNHLHNGFYPTPDAEIYAAMILDYRPLSIVEVGGGFSTVIASKVVDQLHNNCKITVIDPHPRTNIDAFASLVIRNPVENVRVNELPMGTKTLLFIDSSHIVRSRGDVPYLYNRVVPTLPSGALVHVHDIFIPYDYPSLYQKWLYTEQYLVHALLSHSVRYKVVLATHFLTRHYREIMQSAFGEVVGNDPRYYGASLWFMVE